MLPKHLESRIEGEIHARSVKIGKGVVVEEGVVISCAGGLAEEVVLGDFCYIGRNTRILTPEFRLGDYSKLHADSFAHGDLPMQIGRNCWIGGKVVLDSNGGLDIDDNVGIGAQSQIWTHIKFGDIVEGCRFNSSRYMHIGKDAWFVGHCIVSPVEVGERSMALVGSVVTSEMLPNHVYGGVPAIDLTAKVGPQFEEIDALEKRFRLEKLIDSFIDTHPEYHGMLKATASTNEIVDDDRTWFNVSDRTYTRRYSEAEVAFLKASVPLVKFTPSGEKPFIKVS